MTIDCDEQKKDQLEEYADVLDRIDCLKEFAHCDKIKKETENVAQYVRMTMHVAKKVLADISRRNTPETGTQTAVGRPQSEKEKPERDNVS